MKGSSASLQEAIREAQKGIPDRRNGRPSTRDGTSSEGTLSGLLRRGAANVDLRDHQLYAGQESLPRWLARLRMRHVYRVQNAIFGGVGIRNLASWPEEARVAWRKAISDLATEGGAAFVERAARSFMKAQGRAIPEGSTGTWSESAAFIINLVGLALVAFPWLFAARPFQPQVTVSE